MNLPPLGPLQTTFRLENSEVGSRLVTICSQPLLDVDHVCDQQRQVDESVYSAATVMKGISPAGKTTIPANTTH